MSRLYFIIMHEDATLSVEPADRAIPFCPDDIFGPYGSRRQAEDAAIDAEGTFFYLMLPLL